QLQADAAERAQALAAVEEAEAKLPSGNMSLPLPAYAGSYRDRWFGDVVIGERDGKLDIIFVRSPFLRGALEHVGGDLFRTRFAEPGMEDAFIRFQVEDNRVSGASVQAISPLADFSFDYRDLHLVKESS